MTTEKVPVLLLDVDWSGCELSFHLIIPQSCLEASDIKFLEEDDFSETWEEEGDMRGDAKKYDFRGFIAACLLKRARCDASHKTIFTVKHGKYTGRGFAYVRSNVLLPGEYATYVIRQCTDCAIKIE